MITSFIQRIQFEKEAPVMAPLRLSAGTRSASFAGLSDYRRCKRPSLVRVLLARQDARGIILKCGAGLVARLPLGKR